MKPPRGLSAGEAALWRRLTATVTPLCGGAKVDPPPPGEVAARRADGGGEARAAQASSTTRFASGPPPPKGEERARSRALSAEHGLDATWDRKLRTARIEPDFTLDLHGHSLDAAHARLEGGLAQAKAMGARLVLVVTGKPRHAEAADRGSTRGAIRAKVIDWLAAGPHAASIAAIRKAHRSHGGDGALYLVLKRTR
ncbi:MAG TPA: Smr/MutS family protein [Sphingomonadaceae bacterium]